MSTENITKFSEALAADPALASKVQAIHVAAARRIRENLAALSVEAGTPFTAEEVLADATARTSELSDEQLETVAGGTWKANPGNIAASVFSLGLFCALMGAISAGGGNADMCQISHDEPRG